MDKGVVNGILVSFKAKSDVHWLKNSLNFDVTKLTYPSTWMVKNNNMDHNLLKSPSSDYFKC